VCEGGEPCKAGNLFDIQSTNVWYIHEDHERCHHSNAGNAEQNIQPVAHAVILVGHVQHQRIDFFNITFDLAYPFCEQLLYESVNNGGFARLDSRRIFDERPPCRQ